MNQQLNLKKYFFEEINIKLPKFPISKERTFIMPNFVGYGEIYHHRRDKDQFALRWIFETSPRSKNKKKHDLFELKATLVGIFKLGQNKLTMNQKEKYITGKAPKIFYEIVKQSILDICKNSLIEGFRFPDLKSKSTPKK